MPFPFSLLYRLWKKFVEFANEPTNSVGPGLKQPDEKELLLRSIDARLKRLESSVYVYHSNPNIGCNPPAHWKN